MSNGNDGNCVGNGNRDGGDVGDGAGDEAGGPQRG